MKVRALLFIMTLLSSITAVAQSGEIAMQTGGSWSPYVVGGLIGLLVCLTFYFSDEPVGASSFYANVAGFIGNALAPRHTMQLEYYKKNPPKINWEFIFVLAAIFGSAMAALHGGEFSIRGLPDLWTNKYGNDSWVGYSILSFTGGALMAFGARLAGGCTSGHGISGTAQLSVSSWTSLICFFIGGVLAVQLIY